jgi:AcrR family transcriptional regulator
MAEKIIRFDRKKITNEKLINAVGKILAEKGFKELGVNKVAKEAGVDKKLIYRYFGGLPELVKAYSETVDFWPTVDELMGENPKALFNLNPEEQLAYFFKEFIAALRKRPITQEILAWEMVEKNEFSEAMEDRRIKTALEFFEKLEKLPYDVDLTAIVLLMAGAVNFLIVKSRINNYIGGVDLVSNEGWNRINNGIDLLFKGIFDE